MHQSSCCYVVTTSKVGLLQTGLDSFLKKWYLKCGIPLYNLKMNRSVNKLEKLRNAIEKFMAHSAVWGYFPIQKHNNNFKKLTEGKLSKNGF